jgi:hypothetical protein
MIITVIATLTKQVIRMCISLMVMVKGLKREQPFIAAPLGFGFGC